MRTVDPELWYKKVAKPRIQLPRNMKYRQQTVSGVEGVIRAGFVDAMREFRNNCSVRAVVRFGAMDDGWQKNIYALALAVSLSLGVCVVAYDVFLVGSSPPLLVSLQPGQSAALHVHFPAVAVCSTSVFSATALDNYVKFLSSKDHNSTYSPQQLRTNLLNFAALLNRAPAPAPVDGGFNAFLLRVHAHLNLTDLMFRLSPRCESMLRRCSWRGRLLPCERLFATRVTQLGFCCLFNGRYRPEDIDTEPKILDMVGQDFGLTFLLRDTEEFIYARRPSVGYEVLIFEGSEYPLMEGGGVRSCLVPRGAAVFVSLAARAERAGHTLRYYSEEWRGCRVRAPRAPRSWRSSYAWCLAHCRRDAIAALCACAPHTLPADPADPDRPPAPPCTPDNLACLNKYREKFMYYYPAMGSRQWSRVLGQELQDALACLHCVPDCARLVYSARVAYARRRHGLFRDLVSDEVSMDNASLVRVFFTSEQQHQTYVVEGFQRWYEVTAMMASEWVSVAGVPALLLAELLFHCGVRWPRHCWRRARGAGGRGRM